MPQPPLSAAHPVPAAPAGATKPTAAHVKPVVHHDTPHATPAASKPPAAVPHTAPHETPAALKLPPAVLPHATPPRMPPAAKKNLAAHQIPTPHKAVAIINRPKTKTTTPTTVTALQKKAAGAKISPKTTGPTSKHQQQIAATTFKSKRPVSKAGLKSLSRPTQNSLEKVTQRKTDSPNKSTKPKFRESMYQDHLRYIVAHVYEF